MLATEHSLSTADIKAVKSLLALGMFGTMRIGPGARGETLMGNGGQHLMDGNHAGGIFFPRSVAPTLRLDLPPRMSSLQEGCHPGSPAKRNRRGRCNKERRADGNYKEDGSEKH